MKSAAKLYLILLGLIFPCCPFALEVDIYHTNDAHGFYYPGKSGGGAAALGGFLSAQQKPFLLFDGGDFLAGTYEAKKTQGLLSVELMNMLGYTAATIGNHEGDFGQENLLKALKKADFDILAANMRGAASGEAPAGILPYKIYEIKGKKIGVIGLARDPLPKSEDIKTGRDITGLKKALAEIKARKADAVILLTHITASEEADQKTKKFIESVKRIGGVDLMLCAHYHKIINKKQGGILFVESGAELRGLSKITLNFNDKTGLLEEVTARYIPLNSPSVKPDEKIQKYAAKYYAGDLDETLAFAESDLKKYSPGKGPDIDSPLGNLFADIIHRETGADIAVHNTESVRTDIPKGAISKRLAFEVFPFDKNKIVIVKAPGRFVRTLARVSLKNDASALQYSGLRFKYTYKNGKPYITEMFVNNKPLEDSKIYTIAINDYNASGRSEGYLFKNIKDKQNFGEITIAELFVNYLKANPQGIKAPDTGRIQKISKKGV